jgi:hypothetical protein
MARAQYTRADFSLINAQGQAVSGANVYVVNQPNNCTQISGSQYQCGLPPPAVPTPGPLSTIYGSVSGSGTATCGKTAGQIANPVTTDGFGHACAYVAGGTYTVCYYSTSTGTICYPDQNFTSPSNCTISGCVPVSGGTMTGALNVPVLNNVIKVDQEPGSTADQKFAACISALAALTGGICDAQGFAATTQTIAATVATASNVFLKMSPATTFQPSSASTDMFSIAENSGITGLTANALNVTNYSGNVVKFVNNCQQNDACYLRDFWLANGSNSTNPGTGTAILVQGNSAGTVNMSTVHIGPGQIVGFQNGIYLQSLGPAGTGFVNDTAVSTVKITNAVNCINLYSDPGDVYGNTFSQVSCEAGAGNISGAIGYWSHGVSGTVNQKANQFIGGNIWDYGNGSSTQYPYSLDSHTSEAFIQASIPVGNNGVQTDAGTSDQIWNLNYPLKIQQLGIGCLILEPAGSPDVLYSIYNNGTNIVVGNGSSCPGSNPVEIDSAGDLNPSGNVNVGTAGSPNYIFINPATGGGTKWYIDNTGTLLRISNGLTGPGTNPVSIDPNGNFDIPSGAEYLYNGAQINFTNLAGSASTAQLPNSAAQVDSTTPTSGIVACVKTIGPPVVLGYCSTVVGAGGSCTCN